MRHEIVNELPKEEVSLADRLPVVLFIKRAIEHRQEEIQRREQASELLIELGRLATSRQ
jgi:hypothetical protein